MRTQLREQTHAAHGQLDSFLGSLSPFSSHQGYRIYLLGMHRLYEIYKRPLEDAASWSELAPIGKDLQECISIDLGEAPEPLTAQERSWTREETWASAYVLEGSSMGARHIIKTVEQASMPRSFLTRLAGDSKHRWPRFINALDSAGEHCNVEETVNAANAVFAVAKQTFQIIAAGEMETQIAER